MAAVRADIVERSGTISSRRAFRVERWLIGGFDLVAMVVVIVLTRHQGYQPAHVVLTGLVLVVSWLSGSYRQPRISGRAFAEVRASLHTAIVPLVIAGAFALFGRADLELVRFAAAIVPAVVIARVTAAIVIKRLRRSGRLEHRAVIVGHGTIADQLERTFTTHPSMGVRVVGFVAEPDPDRPVLGNLSELTTVLADHEIEVVLVAYSSVRDHQLSSALRTLRRHPAEVFVVPRLFDSGAASGDLRTQSCAGIPVVWLPHREWRPEQLAVKRMFDIAVSSIGLLLAAPVMAVIAVAIKLTSPGPIIFRQIRLGRDHEPFEMYKFRSLRADVDPTAVQSGGDSPHRTPVGTFIRKYSLDELPQLFNVLRGDMSVVGPRPEQPHFVAEFQHVPGYADRHRVPVGITGWAQVNELRGSSTSLDDRAMFDNYYIEHWSIWLDLEIVVRTVTAALKGS